VSVTFFISVGERMKREHFVKVVEEALDSLPQEFRSRIQNVAVLVADVPPNQPSPKSGQQRRLLLGVFHGVPTTKKSVQPPQVLLGFCHLSLKFGVC
jgi:predicted Zn-dependent protease with MMP-like domain